MTWDRVCDTEKSPISIKERGEHSLPEGVILLHQFAQMTLEQYYAAFSGSATQFGAEWTKFRSNTIYCRRKFCHSIYSNDKRKIESLPIQ